MPSIQRGRAATLASTTAITLTLLAACATSPRQAESPMAPSAESGAFLVTLGNDTIAAERYTRRSSGIEGEVLVRSPQTVRRPYSITLEPDGMISRLEFTTRRPNAAAGDPPVQTVNVTFASDTATTEARRGDSAQVRKLAVAAGTIPMLGLSYAAYETLVMRARRAGGDSVAFTVLPVGSQSTQTFSVVRLGADSVRIITNFGTLRARVDDRGKLLGLHAPGTTFQVMVRRVPTIDLAALASAWQPMGVLSPRDTAEANIGGAQLMVDYGRPFKRGRTIFGGIVEWDKVWRTGANQATHFKTDRDLVIGGTTVPAGTYTMWTLPSPAGWKLILNKQTGQWGTAYDEKQDFARIDMKVESVPGVTEQFTAAIEPQESGGVLKLTWDTTQASVPIAVR